MIGFKLSVFRFDVKIDYEPYYKSYKIKLNQDKILLDLLREIKAQDSFFDFCNKNSAYILINQKAIRQDSKLANINEHFGLELNLEPLSKKRTYKDLKIDTRNFDEKINLFKSIINTNEEKEFYQNLMPYFYQSPALKYDELFQGSSLFLFVYKLIEKYPNKKQALLKIINDKAHGIWLHECLDYNIFPRDEKLEDIIMQLKAWIKDDK